MEPNPSVFLRAIRRELKSADLFGAGLTSGASRVIVDRGAEILAQLILRREQLPKVLRSLRSEQLANLEAISQRLRQRQVEIPTEIDCVIERARKLDSEPGETSVELYDEIIEALGEGIRALRSVKPSIREDLAFTNDICRLLCESELKLREEYSRQLEEFRAIEASEPLGIGAALPAPTEARLAAFLRSRLPGEDAIEVSDIRRLVGDNSKDIFFFDIRKSRELDGSYVMRMEPAYNVTHANLSSEYELLRHLAKAGIPVPRVLLGESDASQLGGGFIITAKLPGAPRETSKLGTGGPEILRDIACLSAKIHQVEIAPQLPQCFDAHLSTRDRMLARVDAMYGRWVNERSEDSVIVESAYHWLHANVECLDELAVLTHGDYNLRNILLDGDHVSAILDWELCRVSHPAEDLSYIRPSLEPVIPWHEYLAIYRAHSDYEVTDAALSYFDVWCHFWRLVIGASVYSGYHSKAHRNFVFASVAGVEYREGLTQMASLLAKRL
jgi:aminoglycoside phosphotransferase (APT) family kinase protein